MRRAAALLGLVLGLVAAAAAPAGAAVVELDGAPLNVFADGLGRIQVRYDGQTDGTFFSPTSNTPSAGLEILEGTTSYPAGGRTPLSGPKLGSDATGARTLTSVYTAGPDLQVTETFAYADGRRRVTLTYAIKNVAAVPVSFHAGELADVSNGSDLGTGTFSAGPPRAVGGASVPDGVLTQYVEATPWTSYQSGDRTAIYNAFAAGGLQSTVDPAVQDNGIGAEWDVAGLAPSATKVLTVHLDVADPAPTVRVTTTADHDDQACTASDCTLREAFNHSNSGDVVAVPAGRYLLGGALTLSHSLTVRGAGAGATILDGNAKGRVIQLDNLGDLDLSGVTVTGGRTTANSSGNGIGGGIYVTQGDNVPGALTLRDSVVSGNTGTTNGGGIASQGTTTILDSTISGNTVAGLAAAGAGGGLSALQGSFRLLSSTVSGNTTSGGGAGVLVGATMSMTIAGATIAGNTSSGAGLAGGIAIANNASVTATNTIVAGNGTTNCTFGTGAAVTSGYDLSSDASCRFTATGDQQGADPQLGALADNGGPTPTRLPAATGAAFDRGSPTGCLPADQRGVARPQGAACDVGAVELVVVTPVGGGGSGGGGGTGDTGTRPPGTAPGTGGAGGTVPPGALPPPVAGQSGNLHRAQGTVLVKLPGAKAFIRLTVDQQVPVGTIVDATKGRVAISVSDGHGGVSTAVFYGGIFRFTQTAGAKPLATMTLVGAKPVCASRGKAKAKGSARAAATSKAKKKKGPASRHLWGDGKGNFQTKGQYSSATVRGTKWLVQDTCAGTTTKVARGIVAVRDFVKAKTVLVKAGKSYLARPRRR